jgi:acyl carrier protein phosphodiesterase
VHRELRSLLWDQCEQEEQRDIDPDQPMSTTTSYHQDQPANGRRAHRSRPPRGIDDDQQRWKCEWERDYSSLKPPTQCSLRSISENDHLAVLKALARALRKTEEVYLDVVDKMVGEFSELAL